MSKFVNITDLCLCDCKIWCTAVKLWPLHSVEMMFTLLVLQQWNDFLLHSAVLKLRWCYITCPPSFLYKQQQTAQAREGFSDSYQCTSNQGLNIEPHQGSKWKQTSWFNFHLTTCIFLTVWLKCKWVKLHHKY